MKTIQCMLVAVWAACSIVAAEWGPYRGANSGIHLTEEAVNEFVALGGNLIRLSFPNRPFMELEGEYAFDEEAFSYLDNVLDWCEQANVKVVIDPHRFPGTAHPWTMLGNDEFWEDYKWHDHAEAVWEEIARRCKDRGDVIAGYDLLNEPDIGSGRRETNTPRDLNALYARLCNAIRAIDPVHTIIIAAPRYFDGERTLDYLDGIQTLELPDVENLVVTIHMYRPMQFSHQGVSEQHPDDVVYPGVIDGVEWNQKEMLHQLRHVIAFQKKQGVPIFVGEFSCPRWTGGGGNRYLEDQIQLYESLGWSWAYHSFRESPIWDAERSNTDRADQSRKATTPRLELLKKYWKAEVMFEGPQQPILNVGLADPFVYKANGIYYMIGSHKAPDGRLLPIYKSENLKDWTFVRGAVHKGPAGSWNRENFWAPEVIEYQGKFYCYYTAADVPHKQNIGNRVGVAVAASPEGPFEDVGVVIDSASLDGSPFLDDDGRLYLYFTVENKNSKDWTRGQIRCVEMESPSKVKGAPVPVITHLGWAEGACCLKIDGQYYLLYSTGGWRGPNYQVRAAGRGTSPFGPFVEQVEAILRQNEFMKGTGHNCWFRGPDGDLLTAYHAWDNAYTARYPFISRLQVEENKELTIEN